MSALEVSWSRQRKAAPSPTVEVCVRRSRGVVSWAEVAHACAALDTAREALPPSAWRTWPTLCSALS